MSMTPEEAFLAGWTARDRRATGPQRWTELTDEREIALVDVAGMVDQDWREANGQPTPLRDLRRSIGIDPDDPRLPQKTNVDVFVVRATTGEPWQLVLTSPDGGVVDRFARHPGELIDWLETWAAVRGLTISIELSVWTRSTHPAADDG